jgi:Tol biopolymer transport system component
MRADGTGSAELLYSNPMANEVTVSGTGDWFVVRTGSGQGLDIVGLRPGEDSVVIPLLAEEYDEMAPALSPDSRWLAYTSNESGQTEVYVRPFPNVGDGKWPVSLRGGYAPLWAHNGRELFYISAESEMVVADVETDPVFAVAQRSVLFELGPEFVMDSLHTAHDISPDDDRFIMVRRLRAPETLQPQHVVVDNFFGWLKAKVGS